MLTFKISICYAYCAWMSEYTNGSTRGAIIVAIGAIIDHSKPPYYCVKKYVLQVKKTSGRHNENIHCHDSQTLKGVRIGNLSAIRGMVKLVRRTYRDHIIR